MKKKCEKCKKEPATCWIAGDNVCERCFYKKKKKFPNSEKGRMPMVKWLDKQYSK